MSTDNLGVLFLVSCVLGSPALPALPACFLAATSAAPKATPCTQKEAWTQKTRCPRALCNTAPLSNTRPLSKTPGLSKTLARHQPPAAQHLRVQRGGRFPGVSPPARHLQPMPPREARLRGVLSAASALWGARRRALLSLRSCIPPPTWQVNQSCYALNLAKAASEVVLVTEVPLRCSSLSSY